MVSRANYFSRNLVIPERGFFYGGDWLRHGQTQRPRGRRFDSGHFHQIRDTAMMSDEIARKVLRYRHYCESKESQGLKCHITLEQYLETEYAGDAYGSCGSVWEYTVRALDERELVYDVTGDWWVRTAPVFEKI